MWAGSSNVAEAQEWIRKAILALPPDAEPQLQMDLHAALGSTLVDVVQDEVELAQRRCVGEVLDQDRHPLSAAAPDDRESHPALRSALWCAIHSATSRCAHDLILCRRHSWHSIASEN